MNTKQIEEQLESLSKQNVIPQPHIDYLKKLKEDFKFEPKVIYDIGACVLHWTNEASKIWPNSKIYLFDGIDTVEFLYQKKGYEYNIGVLSDLDNKDLIFYQSSVSPGGNSYYKECSWATDIYYGKDSERNIKTTTVDTVVDNKNFQLPDLIKIDVQGCEIDILRGMSKTLKSCEHLIVELQHSQYNLGALLYDESIPIIESLGFELVVPLFCNNGPDGDYHFKKIK
jgi:FkbM family methyltransferase